MALSFKNTFLEFQGLNDFGVPSAARRSASAPALASAGEHAEPANEAALRVPLDRLPEAISPAAAKSARTHDTLAPQVVPPAPAKPAAPRLKLPPSSQQKLAALANAGFRQLQQRMEEAPAPVERWADEPSEDEGATSTSTRAPDSDESAKKKAAARKGKNKDHRDAQHQSLQDCAMWNHWVFARQWAPAFMESQAGWEPQQGAWGW